MKAVSKLMFGGAAIAALVTAAPAAAQYYPGGGYGGGYGPGYGNNNVVGSILNQILGGGNYRQDDRYAIHGGEKCAAATAQTKARAPRGTRASFAQVELSSRYSRSCCGDDRYRRRSPGHGS